MTEHEAPARVLLVDDRPDNLLALEAILASLGQELVRATSGEEALKQLLLGDFAVILLDVNMPGMDGYETAQHIKRRERTRSVPIIFLTAESKEPQEAFRGYAAGAVDFLTKPFDPWVLRAKVAVFVELWRKTAKLAEQAELLRGVLAADGEAAAAQALVESLRLRAVAVDEQSAALGAALASGVLTEAQAAHEELVARVRRMLAALDALHAGR